MTIRDPQSAIQNLLLVGRVGKTHGVRGAVKVIPETDDPQRLAALEALFLGPRPDEALPHPVASMRVQPTRRGPILVLEFAGIDTIEAATALRGLSVYAREEDLPPLDDDEFFFHDLIGALVVTDRGEPVGTVRDVLELPAHPVYVVARPGRPEAMIPGVPAFVAEIDLEARRLVVQPIDGLLD